MVWRWGPTVLYAHPCLSEPDPIPGPTEMVGPTFQDPRVHSERDPCPPSPCAWHYTNPYARLGRVSQGL